MDDDDGGRRVLLDVLNDPHALESFLGFGGSVSKGASYHDSSKGLPGFLPFRVRSPQSSDVSSTADIQAPTVVELKPVDHSPLSTIDIEDPPTEDICHVGNGSVDAGTHISKGSPNTPHGNGVSSTTNGNRASLQNGSTPGELPGVVPNPKPWGSNTTSKQGSRKPSWKSGSKSEPSAEHATVHNGSGTKINHVVVPGSSPLRFTSPASNASIMMVSGRPPMINLSQSTACPKSSPVSHRPIQPKPSHASPSAKILSKGGDLKKRSSLGSGASSISPGQQVSSPSVTNAVPNCIPGLQHFLQSPSAIPCSAGSVQIQSASPNPSMGPILMNQAMMMPQQLFLSQTGAGMQFLLRPTAPAPSSLLSFPLSAQLPLKQGNSSEGVGHQVMIPGSAGAVLLPSGMLGTASNNPQCQPSVLSNPNAPPILHLAAGTTVHLQQIQTPNGLMTVAIPSGGQHMSFPGLQPTLVQPGPSLQLNLSGAAGIPTSQAVKPVAQAQGSGTTSFKVLKLSGASGSPKRLDNDLSATCRSVQHLETGAKSSSGLKTKSGSTNTFSSNPVIMYSSNTEVNRSDRLGKKRNRLIKSRQRESAAEPLVKLPGKSPLSADQLLLAAVQEAGIGDDDLFLDEPEDSSGVDVLFESVYPGKDFNTSSRARAERSSDAHSVKTASVGSGSGGEDEGIVITIDSDNQSPPSMQSSYSEDPHFGVETASVSTSTCDLSEGAKRKTCHSNSSSTRTTDPVRDSFVAVSDSCNQVNLPPSDAECRPCDAESGVKPTTATEERNRASSVNNDHKRSLPVSEIHLPLAHKSKPAEKRKSEVVMKPLSACEKAFDAIMKDDGSWRKGPGSSKPQATSVAKSNSKEFAEKSVEIGKSGDMLGPLSISVNKVALSMPLLTSPDVPPPAAPMSPKADSRDAGGESSPSKIPRLEAPPLPSNETTKATVGKAATRISPVKSPPDKGAFSAADDSGGVAVVRSLGVEAIISPPKPVVDPAVVMAERQALFEQRLKTDHERVMDPLSYFRNPHFSGVVDCSHTPLRGFQTFSEAYSALTPYHVFQDTADPREEVEFNQVLEDKCRHLMARIDSMKSKYQTLLLKESMHPAPLSEQVMLGRAYVAEEKLKLKQDQEMLAQLGSLPAFESPDIPSIRPSSSASLSQISPQSFGSSSTPTFGPRLEPEPRPASEPQPPDSPKPERSISSASSQEESQEVSIKLISKKKRKKDKKKRKKKQKHERKKRDRSESEETSRKASDEDQKEKHRRKKDKRHRKRKSSKAAPDFPEEEQVACEPPFIDLDSEASESTTDHRLNLTLKFVRDTNGSSSGLCYAFQQTLPKSETVKPLKLHRRNGRIQCTRPYEHDADDCDSAESGDAGRRRKNDAVKRIADYETRENVEARLASDLALDQAVQSIAGVESDSFHCGLNGVQVDQTETGDSDDSSPEYDQAQQMSRGSIPSLLAVQNGNSSRFGSHVPNSGSSSRCLESLKGSVVNEDVGVALSDHRLKKSYHRNL